jgi:hypothetical protein
MEKQKSAGFVLKLCRAMDVRGQPSLPDDSNVKDLPNILTPTESADKI